MRFLPCEDGHKVLGCVQNRYFFHTEVFALRFYFNIRDSQGLISDEEGGDYADIAAARIEANASARDLAVNDIRSGHAIRERQIEIANWRGDVLESVAVLEIVS